jgi:hypothetical protein
MNHWQIEHEAEEARKAQSASEAPAPAFPGVSEKIEAEITQWEADYQNKKHPDGVRDDCAVCQHPDGPPAPAGSVTHTFPHAEPVTITAQVLEVVERGTELTDHSRPEPFWSVRLKVIAAGLPPQGISVAA